MREEEVMLFIKYPILDVLSLYLKMPKKDV